MFLLLAQTSKSCSLPLFLHLIPVLSLRTLKYCRLLGVGDENASKVFFPTSNEVLKRRIDSNTCILLISQSGQTFPTLHATKKMTNLAFSKVWILTGCFNSKMEQSIIESYQQRGIAYNKDRVFNNYSGHRPAEPSSVATAATWHTLTRLLLTMIDICRDSFPYGRFLHTWEIKQASHIIQKLFLQYIYEKKKAFSGSSSSNSTAISFIPGTRRRGFQRLQLMRSPSPVLSTTQNGSPKKLLSYQPGMPSISMINIDYQDSRDDVEEMKNEKEQASGTNRVSLRSVASIDGAESKEERHERARKNSEWINHLLLESEDNLTHNNPLCYNYLLMNLSDGCIDDMKSLTLECLIPNLSDIVGYDQFGNKISEILERKKKNQNMEDSSYFPEDKRKKQTETEESKVNNQEKKILLTNDLLIEQGQRWAAHVNEPWHMLVLVGMYIILSVGCNITFFGIIGDAILAIIRAGLGSNSADSIGRGYLVFTPRIPSVIYHQGIGYTLIGALLQLLDGFFFVYLIKNFTYLTRIIHHRPLTARHGKRTIVIVDNSCVHQLTEEFVSKLFSQAYSIVSLDVHGASGLDHFGKLGVFCCALCFSFIFSSL
jgi:hypothetical protein